jgi:probable addiction module antidote protein
VRECGLTVSELRIDHDAGYRVYFVQQGAVLIVLLAGGGKSSQDRDIRLAKSLAKDLEESSMPKTATKPWDPAGHLGTEEDMAAYLEAALEEGDPALVAAALGDIAKAKGMSQIARDAGLGRESLYKALSPNGNPEFARS